MRRSQLFIKKLKVSIEITSNKLPVEYQFGTNQRSSLVNMLGASTRKNFRIWRVLMTVCLTLNNSASIYANVQTTVSPVWLGVENNTVVNVSAQLATMAFIPCSVKMSGDKQISWIRRRDWHVLTSGVLTYAKDERFSISHREGPDDWTLSIKYLQARDNGTYECQISTDTGIVSQFVNLHVVVPEAFILGNSEYHVQTGSAINLYCIVEQSPIPPQYIFWKHNDRLLNYENRRGGVSVEMEHGAKTASRIIISGATFKDSGNYTCGAPNTEPAHVHVFVSQGDKTAAIQRRTSGGAPLHLFMPPVFLSWQCVVAIIITTLRLRL